MLRLSSEGLSHDFPVPKRITQRMDYAGGGRIPTRKQSDEQKVKQVHKVPYCMAISPQWYLEKPQSLSTNGQSSPSPTSKSSSKSTTSNADTQKLLWFQIPWDWEDRWISLELHKYLTLWVMNGSWIGKQEGSTIHIKLSSQSTSTSLTAPVTYLGLRTWESVKYTAMAKQRSLSKSKSLGSGCKPPCIPSSDGRLLITKSCDGLAPPLDLSKSAKKPEERTEPSLTIPNGGKSTSGLGWKETA